MRPVYIPDHVEQALRRLVTQYKNKPRIAGLIRGLLADVQSEEDVFFSLMDDRTLFNAEGVNLDRIGAIVGQPRGVGEDDEAYRIQIQQRIFKNKSQGTAEIIIELALLISGADQATLLEGAIASFHVQLSGGATDQDTIDALYATLRAAKAAGVRLTGVTTSDPINAFVFDPGIGGGFGDLNDPSVGGEFASLLVES